MIELRPTEGELDAEEAELGEPWCSVAEEIACDPLQSLCEPRRLPEVLKQSMHDQVPEQQPHQGIKPFISKRNQLILDTQLTTSCDSGSLLNLEQIKGTVNHVKRIVSQLPTESDDLSYSSNSQILISNDDVSPIRVEGGNSSDDADDQASRVLKRDQATAVLPSRHLNLVGMNSELEYSDTSFTARTLSRHQ